MSNIRIFVISDNHFGHENIITYCGRPFKSVKEMDEVMFKKWNAVVRPGDLVLYLGDMGLYNRNLDWNLIRALNGNKLLVKGNHDRKTNAWYLANGFIFVCDMFTWGQYIFTHRPLVSTNHELLHKYRYNFHGHIHEKVLNDPQSINVCVEQKHIRYTPRLLWSLIEQKSKGKI